MIRLVLLVALALFTLSAVESQAGDNPSFTFPLHATVALYEPCNGYLPMDCQSVRPRVTVPPDTTVVVFWFIANHSDVAALQTAFEWPSDWSLLFGLWGDCDLQGFPPAVVPQNPGGPSSGAISLAFNCITGPSIRVLSRMTFRTGTSGCLAQTVPQIPGGISVVDCGQGIDLIDPNQQPARIGSVCVGAVGIDACDRVVATTDNTWGAIKATYLR